MTYFVVDLASGQKFGPADLALLNRWAAEGRLTAASVLEEVGTGRRVYASEILGLNVGEGAMPPPRIPSEGYYSQPPTAGPEYADAQRESNAAWIWFAVGIACCGPIGYIMSIVSANRAQALGSTSANVAKILSIVFLVLTALTFAVMGLSAAFS